MFIKPQKRISDSYGSGHYGAPRGSTTHKGIDFKVNPNTEIHSHINGQVTKLGYPYADDLNFRYVQITDIHGFRHRFFYVLPMVKKGDQIIIGNVIGASQELGKRYPVTDIKPTPITEHFHYEVITVVDNKKVFHNPSNFME